MSRIFGAVRQNGYVVRDIHAAMAHWARIGVGPWFYFDHVPVTGFECRGVAGEPRMSIALANSGDLQLELIQQRCRTPSLYWEFMAAHGEGLQHVSAWTTDMAGDLARLAGLGFSIVQQGMIGSKRFVYFDTEGQHPSSTMELYDISGPPSVLFEDIRAAAAGWDGSAPVRRMG